MEGAVIEALLKDFVGRAANGTVPVSEEIIEEFGNTCKDILRRNLAEESKDEFRIRMSNIGRPLCQLKMERDGVPRQPLDYSSRIKFLYGDMIEAVVMALLKASDIPVDAEQQAVSLPIDDDTLDGTDDVEIDGKIYDIKSASDWSFKNKWLKGYAKLAEEDDFGYIAQGFGYAKGSGKKFGGWIVINKNSGELAVIDIPDHVYADAEAAATAKIEHNFRAVTGGEPFKREYTDEEETFYKKATGNRKLNSPCVFCDWKHACWPGLSIQKSRPSTAMNPPLIHYTEINDDQE